jgi:hypothetical protein
MIASASPLLDLELALLLVREIVGLVAAGALFWLGWRALRFDRCCEAGLVGLCAVDITTMSDVKTIMQRFWNAQPSRVPVGV